MYVIDWSMTLGVSGVLIAVASLAFAVFQGRQVKKTQEFARLLSTMETIAEVGLEIERKTIELQHGATGSGFELTTLKGKMKIAFDLAEKAGIKVTDLRNTLGQEFINKHKAYLGAEKGLSKYIEAFFKANS